jgi:hypothetical protein
MHDISSSREFPIQAILALMYRSTIKSIQPHDLSLLNALTPLSLHLRFLNLNAPTLHPPRSNQTSTRQRNREKESPRNCLIEIPGSFYGGLTRD